MRPQRRIKVAAAGIVSGIAEAALWTRTTGTGNILVEDPPPLLLLL
jgi:hypothetical protein